jgi:LysR family nitrogen assimilation transcriptional regulator
MHYRQLYYFVRIVEAGSFSQAARTIQVAQPALSQQIADLEASLGVPLPQRSARGVRPTAAGQKFYDEASSILRKYENLPGLVRSSAGDVEGRVSLGMSASLSTTLVGARCRLRADRLQQGVLAGGAHDLERMPAY